MQHRRGHNEWCFTESDFKLTFKHWSPKNWTLKGWALILVGVPLIIEVSILCMLNVAMAEAEAEANSEKHSKEIVATLQRAQYGEIESAMTLAFYNQTKNQDLLNTYVKEIADLQSTVDKLVDLTADEPDVHAEVLKLHEASVEGQSLSNQLKDEMMGGRTGFENGYGLIVVRKRTFDIAKKMMRLVREIQIHESAKLDTRESRDHLKYFLLIAGAINVIFPLALTVLFYQSKSSRLRVLLDNNMRISSGVPLHPPLSGEDEIAQIDDVFHQMAVILETAARKERAIVDNAIDVICSIDEKLIFQAVSPASESVFGTQSRDLLGMKLVQILLPEDVEKTRAEFERVKLEKHSAFVENQVVRKDGSLADMRWSVQWSPEDKAFYCVASDITARREVERLKQEFVSMMSHDLRTPLMSIQASLALLAAGASGDLSASASRHVGDAERNIAYIISLINSLIDVERISSAKLQIFPSTVLVQDAMENAVQAVRGLAANKGIELDWLPCEIEAFIDQDRIVQVLINLISNAIKFSERGAKIRVFANERDSEVEICVQDNGRGIPEDALDDVFKRFEQVEKTDASEKKGSGLGLAICRAIVEAHGGTIGVRSKIDEGSTFWFLLPLQQP